MRRGEFVIVVIEAFPKSKHYKKMIAFLDSTLCCILLKCKEKVRTARKKQLFLSVPFVVVKPWKFWNATYSRSWAGLVSLPAYESNRAELFIVQQSKVVRFVSLIHLFSFDALTYDEGSVRNDVCKHPGRLTQRNKPDCP